MHLARVVLFVALSVAGAAFAQQPWPAKPLRIVLANSPGAIADVAGRVFADRLGGLLARPVTVDNRPGADGFLAAEAVARSAPDGYTLFFASQSYFAIDPHTKKSLPVDPEKDFTPIAVMIDDTGAIALLAHPSLPVSTLPELIAHAKANPGKVSYATAVPILGMVVAWVNRKAGIDMTEVRYKVAAQANQDVLAGTVPILVNAFGPFEQHIKAGRLRVIAVTRPVEDWPQVQTIASVFPDFRQNSFIVLVGPAGMPADVVRRLNAASAAIVEDPKFNQDLQKLRWRNLGGARTPQGTTEFIRGEREAWGRFIRDIGIKPE